MAKKHSQDTKFPQFFFGNRVPEGSSDSAGEGVTQSFWWKVYRVACCFSCFSDSFRRLLFTVFPAYVLSFSQLFLFSDTFSIANKKTRLLITESVQYAIGFLALRLYLRRFRALPLYRHQSSALILRSGSFHPPAPIIASDAKERKQSRYIFYSLRKASPVTVFEDVVPLC